jgi:hypothetical protein
MFLTLFLFNFNLIVKNSDTPAFPGSVGLTEEAKTDTETARGHVTRNRFKCPSPNRNKRPSTSKPSLVTRTAARIDSCQDQEMVPEEVIAVGDIPSGWICVKLEPDC